MARASSVTRFWPAAIGLVIIGVVVAIFLSRGGERSATKRTKTDPAPALPAAKREPRAAPVEPAASTAPSHPEHDHDHDHSGEADEASLEAKHRAAIQEAFPVEEVAPKGAPQGEIAELPPRPPPLTEDERRAKTKGFLPILDERIARLEREIVESERDGDAARAQAWRIELARLRQRKAELEAEVAKARPTE